MDGPGSARAEEEVFDGDDLQPLVDGDIADEQKRVMRMLRYDAVQALRIRDMPANEDEDVHNMSLVKRSLHFQNLPLYHLSAPSGDVGAQNPLPA